MALNETGPLSDTRSGVDHVIVFMHCHTKLKRPTPVATSSFTNATIVSVDNYVLFYNISTYLLTEDGP